MIPSPVSLKRLERIVRRLRSPGGCPWDRRQTHRSLRAGLIEEAYEVLDAVERNDPDALKEELGDLMLQIVLHAEIERERGRFRLADAIRHVSAKLVRRHPHVFGRGRRVDAEGALKQWEILKREERAAKVGAPRAGAAGARTASLDSVPRALPALLRAARIQSKAARLGFEWQELSQALAKFDEETRELKAAVRSGRRGEIEHELGDALFALAKVARFVGLDPEGALQTANARFVRRFHSLEKALARSGRMMHRVPPMELYGLWRKLNPSRVKTGH